MGKMNYAYKTKNGNFLIPDKKNTLRFIDSDGNHIRYVDREEANYLVRVLKPIDLDDIPKILDKNKSC